MTTDFSSDPGSQKEVTQYSSSDEKNNTELYIQRIRKEGRTWEEQIYE